MEMSESDMILLVIVSEHLSKMEQMSKVQDTLHLERNFVSGQSSVNWGIRDILGSAAHAAVWEPLWFGVPLVDAL